MKIVHYVHRLALMDGGVARFLLDTCQLQARAGHEVLLLSPQPHDVPASWARGPRVVQTSPPAPGRWLTRRALREVCQHLSGASVLHLHEAWYWSHLQLAEAAASYGLRTILSPHGMLSPWSLGQKPLRKRLFLRLAERRLSLLNAIHCTSEQERQDVLAILGDGAPAETALAPFDLEPFRVLPGAVEARRRWALPNTTPVLLFLGRLHPKKRVDLLIEAAGRLPPTKTRPLTVVAGTGPAAEEARLRALIRKRGLEGQVQLLGHVDGREKLSLLQTSALLVLPSQHENFGFSAMEALACGTPALISRGLDLWRDLEASGGAEVLARLDVVELTEALVRLLDVEPQELAERGARGRAWVQTTFEPARVNARFEALYTGGQGPRGAVAP